MELSLLEKLVVVGFSFAAILAPTTCLVVMFAGMKYLFS